MEAHRTYYTACVGDWRGPTELHVPGLGSLRRHVGWLDALTMLLLAWMARLPGGLALRTSVRLDGDDVVHTTELRCLGLPAMRSVERLTLDATDGRSFGLAGRTQFPLTPWRRASDVSGTGAVAPDAGSASYALLFLGAVMQQEATRSGDAVTLEQTMPGYRAVHRLRRNR